MRNRQRGFTLIELMISLVLFSFVIAGVLAVAVAMSQGYREQRAAVVAEAAARIPLDFITDAIRQSSPGSGSNAIWDGYVCTDIGIEVYNNVGTGAAINTDRLDVIYASGAVITSSRSVYSATTQSTLDVSDSSQFVVGDSFVLSDTVKGTLLRVTGISGNTLSIAPQTCGGGSADSKDYPQGSLVIRAVHALFYIGSIDGNPTLMYDPDGNLATNDAEPLAEGVEDLQLVKAIDRNLDGIIGAEGSGAAANTDEWAFNSSGDPTTFSGILHAIRVNLVARTTSGLIGNLKSFNRPKVEDHAAAAVNSDNFRRRVLRATVDVRNFSVSP